MNIFFLQKINEEKVNMIFDTEMYPIANVSNRTWRVHHVVLMLWLSIWALDYM